MCRENFFLHFATNKLCLSGYGRAVVAVVEATGLDDDRLQPTPNPELAEPLSCFAANLRRARLSAALSQEELAAHAEMHRTALSRLETCERAPESRAIIRLARALNVTPASLLRGVR
jgi:ribosome-binding protein aMBF1 (putative translation factor)